MELFDIVDESGNPTGKVIGRSEAHALGIRHRTAHIWVIRHDEGVTEVLLQKRSRNKDSFPGRYDTSSAGHIQAGDEPLPSALRELYEELGIQAHKEDLSFAGTFHVQYEKIFHDKPFRDDEIAFVYVYDKEIDLTSLELQKEEVESVRWFALDDVYQGVSAHDETFCVPMKGLLVLMDYLKKHP